MKIEHIAIWVRDLDKMKNFYQRYFTAQANNLYHNQKTGFKSYFLSFNGSCRIELMNKPDLIDNSVEVFGYAHIALAVGDKNKVDQLTQELVSDGFLLTSGPRTTGDGYYESVIKDPEGNLIELTTS
ncbi:MAG TPA: VOC family protein [Tetragenococcus sp.]|nr:VOC family protein [Tetragenococcus sp.]